MALMPMTVALTLSLPVAAVPLEGRVLGGAVPIADSTVTLWSATAGVPMQLSQSRSGADGRFALNVPDATAGTSLYVVARGGRAGGSDNPAIALLTVLGSKAPASVTINELTTVASVWTHNQFIDGMAVKGQPLQLKIAAGNVPSFVDVQTGGYGGVIQDPLNGGQTPTLANFATLANALAGCVTRVRADACASLFAAARGPAGAVPADTLGAAHAIAKAPWYEP